MHPVIDRAEAPPTMCRGCRCWCWAWGIICCYFSPSCTYWYKLPSSGQFWLLVFLIARNWEKASALAWVLSGVSSFYYYLSESAYRLVQGIYSCLLQSLANGPTQQCLTENAIQKYARQCRKRMCPHQCSSLSVVSHNKATWRSTQSFKLYWMM